ncbi:hypothetical protein [Halalkalibacter alkalisediminis]|uniref:Uncharacterized protein n=1 Tax=Halalkalibacter alkalisediminis TaxID=935616 RepID=A0ABV6NAX1_9BACI|nr:hypothetical protein [Halalkalibacter alkalisediminis]
MKQRYFMCFLLATAMLMYGIEFLPMAGSMVDQIFAWGWIAFASMVILGNGLHLLYRKKEEARKSVPIRKHVQVRTKLRG